MANQYPQLLPEHAKFIQRQKIFFIASAAADGRVNLSPKGGDSLRVIDAGHLLWLNLTGSGNETAAHVAAVNRITLMWCAFEGPPTILRAYGTARVIHPRDDEWSDCAGHLPPPIGARQYFLVDVDLVQTSCGYGVPLLDYEGERDALTLWAEKRGREGIAEYWAEKNLRSLDGLPTGVLDDPA